jgi:SAM-dependent methyltransferase
MLHCYSSKQDFMYDAEIIRPMVIATEAFIDEQKSYSGYCFVCKELTRFVVDVGVRFGDNKNLREGLLCERCKLSNRNRLMYLAVMNESCSPNVKDVAIMECQSALYAALKNVMPGILGSEYIDETCVSGQSYLCNGNDIRHEDVTKLSYADDSLDLVVHNDILEHVYDYRAAFKECHRVLKSGGSMVFTMPFFMSQNENLLRGRRLADGSLEHILPPEYHGDPVHPEGAYTFHYFGWKILDDLKSEGFVTAEIAMFYDIFSGYASNHHPAWDGGLMLPVYFIARKA